MLDIRIQKEMADLRRRRSSLADGCLNLRSRPTLRALLPTGHTHNPPRPRSGFDPDCIDFRKLAAHQDRKMARQYEQVVSVVSKSPDDRTQQDALSIVGWFRKKSRLFGELSTEVVCDIIRNCQFEPHNKDDVLIKQADYGDCFYILLRGKVSIYILSTLADDEDVGDLRRRLATAGVLEGEGPIKYLDRNKFGNFIVQLEEGQSFGELALISKDCIRNASIIVDEASDLLVVDRKLYNRSLKMAQMADFEQRNRFVSTCPLFHWWQPRYKRQMAYSIVKETVSFQEYIYKQGQPADKIYFILGGQARIIVNPERHPQQFPQIFDTEEADDHPGQGDESLSGRLTPRSRRPTTAPSGGGRKRSLQRKDVELCLIGLNEILGAAEITLGLKTYYESVQTTEVCETYSLDLKNYDRLIVRRHLKTQDLIRSTVRARLHNRLQRVPQDRCALFRMILQKLSTEQTTQQPQLLITKRKESHPGFGSKDRNRISRQRTMPLRATIQQQSEDKSQEAEELPRPSVRIYTEVEEDEDEVDDDHALVDSRMEARSEDGQRSLEKACSSLEVTENYRPLSPRSSSSLGGEFHDWETSDIALTNLETRINDWISRSTNVYRTTDIRGGRLRTVAMRRVTIENGIRPLPGAKVIVSRKVDERPQTCALALEQPRKNITDDVTGRDVTHTEHDDFSPRQRPTTERTVRIHLEHNTEHPPESESLSQTQASSVPKRRKSRRYSVDDYNGLKDQLAMHLRSRRKSRPDSGI